MRAPARFRAHIDGRERKRAARDLVGIGARDNSRWSQGVRLGRICPFAIIPLRVYALCRLALNGETSTKVPLPESPRDTRISGPQRPR